jgi:hypothetical protein
MHILIGDIFCIIRILRPSINCFIVILLLDSTFSDGLSNQEVLDVSWLLFVTVSLARPSSSPLN